MTKLLSKVFFARAFAPVSILVAVVLLAPGVLFAQVQPQTVALDDSAITPPNTPVTINVVANDTPGTGSLGVPSIKTQPTQGIVGTPIDATITYTPGLNFSSLDPDMFQYEVCDTATPKASCATAWVYVTVAYEVPYNVIPRKLNVKKNGVLPVEIRSYGDTFDVTTIDPATLMIEGVAPLRWNITKRKITLKFSAKDIVQAIGDVSDGDEVPLQLTGELNENSVPFALVGEDTVIIIKKGKH